MKKWTLNYQSVNTSFRNLKIIKTKIKEIEEELNIGIYIHKKIAEEKYKDKQINITLHYYLCSEKNGIIKLNEHENLKWVEKKDFIKYDFVEGDDNVLSLLWLNKK